MASRTLRNLRARFDAGRDVRSNPANRTAILLGARSWEPWEDWRLAFSRSRGEPWHYCAAVTGRGERACRARYKKIIEGDAPLFAQRAE